MAESTTAKKEKTKKQKRPPAQIALDKARELRGSIFSAGFSRETEKTLLDQASGLYDAVSAAVHNGSTGA